MAFLHEQNKLWQHIESLAQELELTIYDLEKRGGGKIIVSIDKATKATAVTSEDCSKLVRKLMNDFLITGESFGLTNEPEIEVCSPGINRVLRLPRHFMNTLGERVKIIVQAAGAKKGTILLLGNLIASDGETACVADEQTKKEVSFLLEDVKSARIDFKFD
jgi:ribosome maturation factor RimP